MNKTAALEETEITDSATGKKIRISTTVRLIYRKTYPQAYGQMRNARLNIIIAKEFKDNSSNILHYFRLGKKKTRQEYQPPGSEKGRIYADVAEIRGTSASFFISAVRDTTIDILTIQNSWLKPKYRGSREKPIALGDS